MLNILARHSVSTRNFIPEHVVFSNTYFTLQLKRYYANNEIQCSRNILRYKNVNNYRFKNQIKSEARGLNLLLANIETVIKIVIFQSTPT